MNTSNTTYRTPAEKASEVRPPTTLVYEATDEGGRADGYIALFRHFTLPLVAPIAVAIVAGGVAGLVALAGAVAYSAWSWRKRKDRGGAVLTVERGKLDVELRGEPPLFDTMRLGDLADVTLDIKTIERVTDGSSAIPAMRFIDSRVAPKVDTARIVLVRADGHDVVLTNEYLPHMHAIEWMGKIRTFLRKHGWLPESER